MLTKSLLFALVAAFPTMTMAAGIFKTDTKPTVLYGELDQILEQILARNPAFVGSEVNPDPEDALSALSKRAEVLTCAVMATGQGREMEWADSRLISVGGNCGAPAKQCRRMTCKNTTGTYICSEGSDVSSVWASYGNCGHSSSKRPTDYPYPGGSPNGLCYN
ncbi:hypothetical protein QBC43DRAFT_343917 [Cladorrhinum sp. PSN259]|nr:hypothetical protein QBC43DRAFT_343917 [Cladorrhinum sp. PSN259]